MSGFKILATVLLFLASQAIFAQNIIHIYNPWVNTSDIDLHLTGSNVTGYNPDINAGSKTKGVDEGGGWYRWEANYTADWETVGAIRACPKAGDQNVCNNSTDKISFEPNPKWSEIFAAQSEVWVTIVGTEMVIGYTPPDARMIWFFSPWGNKSLPRIVISGDTTVMKAVDDPAKCGWFWGAVPAAEVGTLAQVSFFRAHTSTSLPTSGTIDLSGKFATSDTVYVNSDLTTTNTQPRTGACLDKQYVVHVQHPWREDKDRRDLPVSIRAGNVIPGQRTTMEASPFLEGFWSYEFAEGTQFNQNEIIQFESVAGWKLGDIAYPDTYPAKDLFPPGEYEVWIFTEGDSLRISRAPVTAYFINLLNPWNNTAPRLNLNGEVLKTKAFKERCGWFKYVFYDKDVPLNIYYSQALGSEFMGEKGLGDSTRINVQPYFADGDTVWLNPEPYPKGAPTVNSDFPEILGDCAERKLSVIIYDHAFAELDFENVESAGCTPNSGDTLTHVVRGMVEPYLVNGLPAEVQPNNTSCQVHDLENWFVAQPIAGTEYTNATCRDIELEMDEDGFWLADIDYDEANKIAGFFPIDDWYYLDPDGSIPNPNYDLGHSLFDKERNYSFAMHVNADFEYIPGQYFEFSGDDDVWVYINDTLVVDLGGVHEAADGAVNLDTLGLTPGETYNFHIFFAERQTTGSNFKMRTSIDLQTERAFYKVAIEREDGVIEYELRQIVKESGLSCDKTTEGKVDTLVAPSVYLLSGPQFPNGPVKLGGGVNYGGITISENRASFSIDTTAIVRSRTLAPGTYTLNITHALDATLSERILFTVPSYPLPNISFADSTFTVINADSVKLGEWAFIAYPVYIMAEYAGVKCDFCTDQLVLNGGDSIIFLDENQEEITVVELDSGATKIFVMGTREIKDGSFVVSGKTVGNELVWSNINLKEPPVPFITGAEMWDNNGDGIADSLWVQYARAITGEDVPDSIGYRWGDEDRYILKGKDIADHRVADSLIIDERDMTTTVYTGDKDAKVYSGNLTTWYTYIPEDGDQIGEEVKLDLTLPIKDKVGPVVTRAEIGLGKLWDTLYVYISESVRENPEINISPYVIRMWKDGVKSEGSFAPSVVNYNSDSSRATLVFPNGGEQTPRAGDSLKLNLEDVVDFAGNAPHEKNPWVRIKGRARSQVALVNLVDLSPKCIPEKGRENIHEILMPTGSTSSNAYEETCMPGYLLQYDLGEVIDNDPTGDLRPEDIVFEYELSFFSTEGAFVANGKGKFSCADEDLFGGDCTKTSGNPYLAWDMRSSDGRWVGTGVYVTLFKYKIKIEDSTFEDKERDDKIGVRRLID